MTTMLDLATAREVQPNVYQAECPTVHQLFLSLTAKRMAIGARPMVWVVCPLCDSELRTGDDCDPRCAQWHPFYLEAA